MTSEMSLDKYSRQSRCNKMLERQSARAFDEPFFLTKRGINTTCLIITDARASERRKHRKMRKPWLREPLKRGRPAGSGNLRDIGSLEYLIYLSNKHDIDPYELLNIFFKVEEKNTVTCGPLKIVLRKKAKDHAVFLLTRESEIIAQMKFRIELWEEPAKTKRLYSMLIDHAQPLIKPVMSPSSIIELQKGMKNVDLRVKVTGKSEVQRMYSRYNGKPLRLCVATVTDPSGSIRLPLWNDQINSISVGDDIEVKNASVKMFRGLLQIVPKRKKDGLIIAEHSKPSLTKQVTP